MLCCFSSRFVFFHAFFTAKKASNDIPETEAKLSVPLDDQTRVVLVNSFFGYELRSTRWSTTNPGVSDITFIQHPIYLKDSE